MPIYKFDYKNENHKRKIDYLLHRKSDQTLQDDIFLLMPNSSDNHKKYSFIEDQKFQRSIDYSINSG